jgi:hypothetical protein
MTHYHVTCKLFDQIRRFVRATRLTVDFLLCSFAVGGDSVPTADENSLLLIADFSMEEEIGADVLT